MKKTVLKKEDLECYLDAAYQKSMLLEFMGVVRKKERDFWKRTHEAYGLDKDVDYEINLKTGEIKEKFGGKKRDPKFMA